MKMKRLMTIGVCAGILVATSWAQERGGGAKEAAGARRGEEANTPAMRIAQKQKMCEAEKARIEEELKRLNDGPEMSMALAICTTALASYENNLKAQAEAAAAGDAEKLKGLEAQGVELESACWKAKNGALLTRSASENRRKAQALPAAASPEADAARTAYLAALTKLGDFYAEQANNPPDGQRKGLGLPPELQEQESSLKLARERARVEYEYQTDLAKMKTQIEKLATQPESKALADALIEKMTAGRDAELKLIESQDAFQKAQTARKQAEEAMGPLWQRSRGEGRGAEKKNRDPNP